LKLTREANVRSKAHRRGGRVGLLEEEKKEKIELESVAGEKE
jgi:hypothetical protein